MVYKVLDYVRHLRCRHSQHVTPVWTTTYLSVSIVKCCTTCLYVTISQSECQMSPSCNFRVSCTSSPEHSTGAAYLPAVLWRYMTRLHELDTRHSNSSAFLQRVSYNGDNQCWIHWNRSQAAIFLDWSFVTRSSRKPVFSGSWPRCHAPILFSFSTGTMSCYSTSSSCYFSVISHISKEQSVMLVTVPQVPHLVLLCCEKANNSNYTYGQNIAAVTQSWRCSSFTQLWLRHPSDSVAGLEAGDAGAADRGRHTRSRHAATISTKGKGIGKGMSYLMWTVILYLNRSYKVGQKITGGQDPQSAGVVWWYIYMDYTICVTN